MTSPNIENQPVSAPSRENPPPAKTKTRGLWERFSVAIQLGLSLAVAGGVLVYLMSRNPPASDNEKRPSAPEEVVQVVGQGSIRVRSGTPLDGKLQVAAVEAASLTAPVLPVTGTALASLRPGTEQAKDTWQFATADLLSAFTDWQKAGVDVNFQRILLVLVKELARYRVTAQKEVVDRMVRLVDVGDRTEKELVAERVTLKQLEIQEKTDVHNQENALNLSIKTEAALARQLQLAGLEPTSLRSAAAEGEIVVAEVPERVMTRVKLGMTCEVRFFALPKRVFTGKVSSISPVISKEKRVLNVQFIVKDSEKIVRPGMFAEIGLGTDKRQALLMPADGVLHVGDRDYALLGNEPGTWQITEVQTGELRGTNVELLTGLRAGDRVLGKGAVLLKPMVVRALQAPTPVPSAVKVSEKGGGDSG